MDLEYTELVLTTEHPLQHLDIPEMNFYARWASLFVNGNRPNWPKKETPNWCMDELPGITLILMTPDWCRDEMPVAHHFKSSFLCSLGITF